MIDEAQVNNNQNELEKQSLEDLDLSNVMIIKNPNNEVAIGNQ